MQKSLLNSSFHFVEWNPGHMAHDFVTFNTGGLKDIKLSVPGYSLERLPGENWYSPSADKSNKQASFKVTFLSRK